MSDAKKPAPQKYGVRVVKQKDYDRSELVEKALNPTQLSEEDAYNAGDWLEPPYDLRGLEVMVSQSTILPQCARAYRNNIPGFGIGVRYIEDVEETPEMAAEFERATELIELLNLDMDTKEVFEDVIEAREIYGISYLEVTRNYGGEVCQIDFVTDTPSMRKTKPLMPYQNVTFMYKGKPVERRKKFRKYKQTVGGETVYFKEFGDKRVMDNRDGNYVEPGSIDEQYEANEIIEFPIGTKPYGQVRWIGQVLSVDGARKAEGLNYNYFENGRHTPLMIIIKNGTLTDESFEKLQRYMDEIKGASGQHAFLILEAENTDNQTEFEDKVSPDIEIKDLASILQKDELFQDYIDNGRKKVQSAFLLPDLYVGYTTDFNRATAQTAMEVTEKQVFQPERLSLAWTINNRLLNEFGFQYVEAYFFEPDISNPDDLVKILNVANQAGGVTPNKAKQVALNALGETSEDYEGDWGNIPLVYARSKAAQDVTDLDTLLRSIDGIDQQITKAVNNKDDEVVAVMKSVRALLVEMQENAKNDGE